MAKTPIVPVADGATEQLRINDEVSAELATEDVSDSMPRLLGHIEEEEWDEAYALSGEIRSNLNDVHEFLKTKVQH